jgi:hypothetical protein
VAAANVYAIAQIIELATGSPANAAQITGWTAYENSGGSLQSIVDAFVASTMFAQKYNGGIPVDPESPISATIAHDIIQNALEVAPGSQQLSSWLDTGLNTAEVFQDFALGDQFSSTLSSQVSIIQSTDGTFHILPIEFGQVQIMGISDFVQAYGS